jgi:FkbM family methyltransferase
MSGNQQLVFIQLCLRSFSPTIFCFEPFSANFEKLSKNISTLRGVHSYKLAMGSSVSNIEVPLAPHPEWHSIANRDSWNDGRNGTEKVDVTTLETFFMEQRISAPIILKTDTEGYDLEVLKGAKSLLENHIISIIMCEVGFNIEDKQHSYFPHIFDYLLGFGYRLYAIDEQCSYKGKSWGNTVSIGYANAWFVSPVCANNA